MSALLISLDDISVSLNGNQILSGVSFDIYLGKCYAVIGKSGSGKTMLLKVIAGLQSASGGKVTYNPQYLLNHHQITFVDSRHHFKNRSNTTDLYYQQRFNSSDSEDALTVSQHLSAIAASMPSGYWDLQKVQERLKLQSVAGKELIKLSNGETKRLRLASALLKNPKLLLLDQPLTGLDIDARKAFNQLLAEISGSGITTILTNSPGEIPHITNKVLWLENGLVRGILNQHEIPQKEFDDEGTSFDSTEIGQLLSHQNSVYQTFIRMINVNVRYGDKQILKNINWEIKQGDRWALLGHNGAGKSTLLSLIYGDNPQAYANDIVLFDKQRGTGESIWDIKKKCGFVSPELFQYFPTDNNCLQVIESGFYDTVGLFRQSDPGRAAIALRWMKILDIDAYCNQQLRNIPASAQRLCMLARALVKNPALLILDEPCQGLDDAQKIRFKNITDAICLQSNLTIIYVTHYKEELPNAVNQYLKLENGGVVN